MRPSTFWSMSVLPVGWVEQSETHHRRENRIEPRWVSLTAHQALSCSGYSRTDFIISQKGPVYLETNTLPGLTKASLYPKSLKVQGIEFADFLQGQIDLAQKRTRK